MRNNPIIRISIVMLICLTVLGLQSCIRCSVNYKRVVANDDITTKNIPLEKFDDISVAGPFDLIYEQEPGGSPRLVVEGPSNIIEVLKIKQDDNEINIGTKNGVNVEMKGQKLTIHAYSEGLESLIVTGSGKAFIHSDLKTEEMDLKVTGSGSIESQKLQCLEELSTTVTGSGYITLSEANSPKINTMVTGSGDTHLKSLTCGTLKANITGSGHIDLEGIAEKADFSITGSGNIYANRLETKKVTKNITGSGKVETSE